MKINNGNNIPRPHVQSQKSQPNVGKVSNQRASGLEGTSASVETSSIENLTALLEDGVSNVRDSLVQEIKLKIQTGEYLTQKAAVDTADAILNL